MNLELKKIAAENKPKNPFIQGAEKDLYELGLMILANNVHENFLDIPPLPEDKYGQEGFFYSIPYLEQHAPVSNGKTRVLLVVYKIENRTSYCPLKIEAELIDQQNYRLTVCDQREDKTIRKELLAKENGSYSTQIQDYDEVTLSQLITL